MNVDVKNAFDKVVNLYNGSQGDSLPTEILAKDIYAFIKNISADDADDRFDYFSDIYLNGKFKADNFKNSQIRAYPETLTAFSKIDANSNSDTKLSKILVSFFTILGQSYLSSGIDKKDINKAQLIECIKDMNAYADKNAYTESTGKSSYSALVKNVSSDDVYQQEGTEIAVEIEPENEPIESLEELQEQLDSLIGLDGVKKEVEQIINLIKVRNKGEAFGEKLPPISLHLVFFGNPGTGKTTVARLLAKIYRSLGVLSKGHMVEVDRSKLVAGYVGQTAIKTQDVIDQSMGGILFIDEAYTLTHGKGDTDFGQEAVDTILKAMEDHRDDFIVIVAGYPELMKEFISSNPGLKSRFNKYINFEDYVPQELVEIFKLQCQSQHYTFDEGCDEFLSFFFESMYNNRTRDYANGRDVRNYFENVVKARANRLVEILDDITHEEYLTVTVADLEQASNMKSEI